MSKNSRRAFILGLSAIAAVGVTVAWGQDHDDMRRPATRPAPPPLSLEAEMRSMNRDYRLIRRQVKDPTKNASTLAAVQDLELHTVNSKGITPESATTMPSAADRSDKLNKYRSQMLALLQQELKLEQQLIAGDNTAAAVTSTSLNALERQGHRDFRMEND